MSRKRPIQSGWCNSAHHEKCAHRLQEANEKRPEIWCACRCHTGQPKLCGIL